jgi:RecA-family ATPase
MSGPDDRRPPSAAALRVAQRAGAIPAPSNDTDPGRRFEWLQAADIFAELPPTKWVVEPLQICPGRPTLWAGYGASAKTLSLQSLALSLASGTQLWGHFSPVAPLQVQHIDYEQGPHATMKRYQRLAVGMSLDTNLLHGRLRLTCLPTIYLNAFDAESAYCRECELVDLCIVDSLKGGTPGTDENDAKIRDHLDMLTRVSAKTGCAFVVIHHAGKPKGEGAGDKRHATRGSSAIFDACGSVYMLDGERGAPKEVTRTKTAAESAGEEEGSFGLAIESVQVGPIPNAGVRVVYRSSIEGLSPPDPAARQALIKSRIVSHLESNTDVRHVDALARRVGFRASDVRAAVRELEDESRLVRDSPRDAWRVA